MKKFKTWLKVEIVFWMLYIFIWLCVWFINWEIRNPFEWVFRLSTMNETDRFIILFYALLLQAGKIYITYKKQ